MLSGTGSGTGSGSSRFLKACRKVEVDRPPVWIMRQAGRYLPEYRATRAEAGDFMSLCRNAELACEVTMQPLRRYKLDAAILFSDILTVPDALGLGLYFVTGEGPKFERPVQDAAAIRALGVPDPVDSLGYVMDAVRTIRRELDGRVPLIGFCGAPFTVAAYLQLFQAANAPPFSISSSTPSPSVSSQTRLPISVGAGSARISRSSTSLASR